MERRQTVLETELKLCKFSRHANTFPAVDLRLSWQQKNLFFLLLSCRCVSLTRGSSQRHERSGRRFQDLIRGSSRESIVVLSDLSTVCVFFCFCTYSAAAAVLQNYDTTESKLRREFEVYGPIKRVSGPGLFISLPSLCVCVWSCPLSLPVCVCIL